jgi:hypothetical protein
VNPDRVGEVDASVDDGSTESNLLEVGEHRVQSPRGRGTQQRSPAGVQWCLGSARSQGRGCGGRQGGGHRRGGSRRSVSGG